jgi:hypothetical protein
MSHYDEKITKKNTNEILNVCEKHIYLTKIERKSDLKG